MLENRVELWKKIGVPMLAANFSGDRQSYKRKIKEINELATHLLDKCAGRNFLSEEQFVDISFILAAMSALHANEITSPDAFINILYRLIDRDMAEVSTQEFLHNILPRDLSPSSAEAKFVTGFNWKTLVFAFYVEEQGINTVNALYGELKRKKPIMRKQMDCTGEDIIDAYYRFTSSRSKSMATIFSSVSLGIAVGLGLMGWLNSTLGVALIAGIGTSAVTYISLKKFGTIFQATSPNSSNRLSGELSPACQPALSSTKNVVLINNYAPKPEKEQKQTNQCKHRSFGHN